MACHSDHLGVRLARASRKQFSHELLRVTIRGECESCHTPPGDDMHRALTTSCKQCHTTDHWKPATFDHDKLFLLDRNHNTSCRTCHVAGDFSRYTCYGCHEHQQDAIRAEHLEEGIRDIDNCVKCHRSAHGNPEANEAGEKRETD